jgi:hypothetical protein
MSKVNAVVKIRCRYRHAKPMGLVLRLDYRKRGEPGQHVNTTELLEGFQVGLESRKDGERWEGKREK